jgi:hypothetical protein
MPKYNIYAKASIIEDSCGNQILNPEKGIQYDYISTKLDNGRNPIQYKTLKPIPIDPDDIWSQSVLENQKEEKNVYVMARLLEDINNVMKIDYGNVKYGTKPINENIGNNVSYISKISKHNLYPYISRSPEKQWISSFLGDPSNKYVIMQNEGGGDCFFAVVRDALKRTEIRVTVPYLRNLVANNFDEKIFDNRKSVSDGYEKERITQITNEINVLSSMPEKTNEDTESIEQLKKELSRIESDKIKYFGYSATIQTFDEYKKFIKTSDYWADEDSISILEYTLGVRFIIFDEEKKTIECLKKHEKLIEIKYYIMANYNNKNQHYELITYNKRSAFRLDQLPEKVQKKVADKCKEEYPEIETNLQNFSNIPKNTGGKTHINKTKNRKTRKSNKKRNTRKKIQHSPK